MNLQGQDGREMKRQTTVKELESREAPLHGREMRCDAVACSLTTGEFVRSSRIFYLSRLESWKGIPAQHTRCCEQ
jgi:hypothetical protein